MTRTCGSCTACCDLLGVEDPELTKPAGEMCRHCEPGKAGGGCRIYMTRPKACQNYRCAWLDNEWLGDELRPDRCGILIEGEMTEKIAVFMVRPGYEHMCQSPKVQEAVRHVVAGNKHTALIVKKGIGKMDIYTPQVPGKDIVGSVTEALKRIHKRRLEQAGA